MFLIAKFPHRSEPQSIFTSDVINYLTSILSVLKSKFFSIVQSAFFSLNSLAQLGVSRPLSRKICSYTLDARNGL